MTENSLVLIKPDTDNQLMAFYTEALDLKRCAEARVILTNDDLKPANDDLAIIARIKKAMEEKRREYLRPFQDHVKETNEAYKTFMEPIEQADRIIRDKVLAFRAEQERKRREAEAIEAEKLALARREAELKGGEITVDLTPVAKPDIVPDRTRTELGSSGQRDNWKWELIDIQAVPFDYLMVNGALLTKIVKASQGRIQITGIRIFNEPIIVVNTR